MKGLVSGIAAVLAASLFASAQAPVRTDAPAPQVSVVSLPRFEGAHAIWGATGQDARGHIWFGVTSGGIEPNSAHLFDYDPESGTAIDRGDVVSELQRAGLRRKGEQQAKIHSRIIQGPDEYLYFASMDEEGENPDGSKLPTWGGHLWRLSIETFRWEHLLRTPEALIAVGGGGRFIYALGYFGHVLYQYDTRTGAVERTEVGSVDGHISRNFLVDYRGHAYVPRLTTGTGSGADPRVRVTVQLVEFGTDFRELRVTPLDTERYLDGNPTASHGIVGLQEMTDGSIFFTTHVGFLGRVVPPARGSAESGRNAPADVVGVGWLHPDGESYPASLFSSDGASTLSSLTRRRRQPFEWLTCTPAGLRCRAAPLVVPGLDDGALARTLLYGSSTRDGRGGHYVVGIGNDYRPIILRVQGGRP